MNIFEKILSHSDTYFDNTLTREANLLSESSKADTVLRLSTDEFNLLKILLKQQLASQNTIKSPSAKGQEILAELAVQYQAEAAQIVNNGGTSIKSHLVSKVAVLIFETYSGDDGQDNENKLISIRDAVLRSKSSLLRP